MFYIVLIAVPFIFTNNIMLINDLFYPNFFMHCPKNIFLIKYQYLPLDCNLTKNNNISIATRGVLNGTNM